MDEGVGIHGASSELLRLESDLRIGDKGGLKGQGGGWGCGGVGCCVLLPVPVQ